MTILDDGIEKDHPDLISNYASRLPVLSKIFGIHKSHSGLVTKPGTCELIFFLMAFQDADASHDVNDNDADPQPRYTQRNENR